MRSILGAQDTLFEHNEVRIKQPRGVVYLRNKIADHLDAGGDLAEAYYVDQTPYAHLDTFEELATRNAGRVYEQMEFE